MNSMGTSKIDRAGLSDEQYIAALEVSNETLASEVFRLRQLVLASKTENFNKVF